MRKNSKKQTAASRANGAKGKGATSAAGKQKSRLNALKSGFFSTDIVVPAAGERVEDFERFKDAVWDSVQPQGALEEILVNDLAENYWRRQRVRRSEAGDTQMRLENHRTHQWSLSSDEIEAVKIRFHLFLERYQAITTSTPPADVKEIVTGLENARARLASSTQGIGFLIMKVNAIKSEVESTGQMSPASEAALRACAGVIDDLALFCRGMNWVNKIESAKVAAHAQARQPAGTGQTKEVGPEKAKSDQAGGQRKAGEWNEREGRDVLVSMIECIALRLESRRRVLESNRNRQSSASLAAAVLPADSSGDRFSRAETAYDRRFYRALGALLTIRQGKDASKILPG
jgi:hypothetical protein